jgi:hypothetical protein
MDGVIEIFAGALSIVAKPLFSFCIWVYRTINEEHPEVFTLPASEDTATGDDIDVVFEHLDGLMREGNFEEVNSLLENNEVCSTPTDILLTVLTATKPAKSLLPARKDYFSRVFNEIDRRGLYVPGLLTGLE